MARKCSNCGAEMQPETIHGVGLDVCPRCGGNWLQADELNRLMNSGPLAQDDLQQLGAAEISQSAQGTSHMRCPNDDSLLETYHYMYNSPLILHTCPQCGGFWVAPGEIAKMEVWHDQALGPATAKETASEVLASAQIEHDNEMRRSLNTARFFGVLNRTEPGWLGLIP